MPSANRITLLRDADGDGVAETRTVFLENLNSPFGMALVGDDLYVANTDARRALPVPGRATRRSTAPGDEGRRPAGRAAQPSLDQEPHRAAATARKLYVDGRLEQQRRRERHGRRGGPRRDLGDRPGDRRSTRIFASGLRNPVRHGLGAGSRRAVDGGQRARRARQRSRARLHDLGAATAASTAGPTATTASTSTSASSRSARTWSPRRSGPDYALGAAHRLARPGLRRRQPRCPRPFADGMFVGQHGSWNRKPPSGYKVIFVPFADGQPSRPADRRPHRLPRRRRRRAAAARSASRSTRQARCSWPTTSAT